MTITPIIEVKRDRWGRPLITPTDGGKPIAYTRATTLAGALDDLHGLMGWKQRMTAVGITDRPDLQVAVSAHRDDKKRLDAVVNDAMEAASASAAATTGTALHAFTEQIDRGTPPTTVPERFKADLDAYIEVTRDLTALHIEQMSVIDELQVAGTPDRIVEYQGELYVADLKTGSIAFPHKIALQLALYARAKAYDLTTGERAPWHPSRTVNTDRALIIHLPAGTGKAELVWVNIAAGWEAVDLAVQVRAWRKRKDLVDVLTTAEANTPPPPVSALPNPAYAALENQIATATNADAIRQMWANNQPIWDQNLTDLASARTALLDHRVVR